MREGGRKEGKMDEETQGRKFGKESRKTKELEEF